MANQNTDLLEPEVLTGFARTIEPDAHQLRALLPPARVEAITFKAPVGGSTDAAAAEYRALDAEAPIGTRPGIAFVEGAIQPISKKLPLGEELSLTLDALKAGGDMQSLIDQVYNDTENLVRSIHNRLELARAEAIDTGKLTLNENGVIATIDYLRTASHGSAALLTTARWLAANAATAVPLTNLRAWHKTYRTTNGTPAGVILIGEDALEGLLVNDQIRNLVQSRTNVSPNTVDFDQLNGVLRPFGLPPLQAFDELVTAADGTKVRALPADRIWFLPRTEDVPKLGRTQFGTTIESLKMVQSGRIVRSEAPGIIAAITDTFDSVLTWTKASAMAVPVLFNPDLTFAATVT